MKKYLIAGLILIGTMAYGKTNDTIIPTTDTTNGTIIPIKFSDDVEANKIVIENLKAENQDLAKQLDKLKETLSDWKLGLIKHTGFADQGVYISREKKTFTLKIESNDLSDRKYNKLFESLVEVMKYDTSTTVTVTANDENLKYLKDYLEKSEIDEEQVSFINPDNVVIDGKNPPKTIDTTDTIIKDDKVNAVDDLATTTIVFTKALSDEEKEKINEENTED